MSTTYYRVVCDRHTPPLVLADVICDPECEASQHYERQVQRWDRHASGEEPMLDRFGNPYPRQHRPYLYRHSSRQITVDPHEDVFVPELVDRSGPADTIAWIQERAEAICNGLPPPRRADGYVRVLDYEVGDAEHADGRTFEFTCRCELHFPAAADTLALVLDKIGDTADTVLLPVVDRHSGRRTGETVDVAVVTLKKLCDALGGKPRG